MIITNLSSSLLNATGPIQEQPGIAITEFISTQGQQFVITAIATKEGKLRLISWRVSQDGKSITRAGDSGDQAGFVSRIAIVSQGSDCLVTGVRTAEGKLKLIAWRLNIVTGHITRLSESPGFTTDAVSVIRLATNTSFHFFVGGRDAAGKLVLQKWHLNPEDDLLYEISASDSSSQVGKAITGEISDLALGSSDAGVFTAVRSSAGHLKIIIWETQNGSFKRLGDSGQQGPSVSLVDALSFSDLIITIVRDSHGRLKLITWQVSANGKTVNKLGDSDPADAVDLLACQFFPYDDVIGVPAGTSLGRVFTAVRTGAKTLKIIGWQVNVGGAITPLGVPFERQGTVDAVAFLQLAIDRHYVSAVRDAEHRLRLDVWQMNAS